MSRVLRKRPRVCYYEPEEPPFDEFIFCTDCGDYVYEYCSIHGPLLVIPDEKVPAKTGYPDFVPRAALTIPQVFLHLAHSHIEGAGLGVFSSRRLPAGARFGPYRGARAQAAGDSSYAWQIYDKNHKPSHVVDASDDNASNWMRYVNCSRHVSEQNLVAYQYQGQLYYRTIKVIPRFTELLVFYGSEFAATLGVQLRLYSVPCECYACQPKLPKKAQVKGNKRQALIEDKPREEIKQKNPVEKFRERAVQLRNDSKTNVTTVPASVIATENPKAEKSKKKKNGKKSPVVKLQEPVNESTETSVASVNKEAQIVTEIALNERNLKAATLTFKCDKCGKIFAVKSDLEKHIHNHTNVDRADIQKYSSKGKPNLKIHEGIRTGDKPYTCNYCSQSFRRQSHLTTHERIHTGEKPYKCNFCSKSFTQKIDLTRHERIHTGEKPYKCNFCSKSFTQISNLRTHERVHRGEKPYTCNYCSQSFRQKSNLTIHERIHTGEKPYKCHYCGTSFSHKSHLTRHERIHNGEKPT